MIPADVRDELDMTPRWWFKQFHRLLERVGADVVYGEDTWDVRSFDGSAIYTYREQGYVDCPCGPCAHVVGQYAHA